MIELVVSVDAPGPTALELDGEIVHTSRARFEVLSRWIHVCG